MSGDAENQKEKVSAGSQSRVYRQEKAAPLFYLTDQTMGEKAFQNLTWQEKQIDLLEYAIVPEQKESSQEKAGMENARKDAEDSLSEWVLHLPEQKVRTRRSVTRKPGNSGSD